MEILGLGTDIVQISRIEKFLARQGRRALHRILTEEERELFRKSHSPASFLSGRWAGKEALIKAIRLRIGSAKKFQMIRILRESDGSPRLILSGQLAAQTDGANSRFLISISHEKDHAISTVLWLKSSINLLLPDQHRSTK